MESLEESVGYGPGTLTSTAQDPTTEPMLNVLGFTLEQKEQHLLQLILLAFGYKATIHQKRL